MMPPTSIDGTDIVGATIDGTDVQEITVDGQTVFSAGPANESFEHNDLTANYAGDTNSFQIQSGTVFDGSFALEATQNNSSEMIVRKTGSSFNRFGRKISFKQYHDGGPSNAGLAFVKDVTGYSGSEGYRFYVTDENNYISVRGLDSTSLRQERNYSIPNNQWLDASVEFLQNGDIVFTFDGQTVTVNDTQVTNGYLGFYSFDSVVFWDDIKFSTI